MDRVRRWVVNGWFWKAVGLPEQERGVLRGNCRRSIVFFDEAERGGGVAGSDVFVRERQHAANVPTKFKGNQPVTRPSFP
jgi:hypothetical protein